MASEVTELLVALKEWQKAVKQLKHPGKSPRERAQRFAQAQQTVVEQLYSDAIAKEIDNLVQTAMAARTLDAATVRQWLQCDRNVLLSIELKTIQPMNASRTKLEKIATHYLKTPEQDQPLDDAQQLHQVFLTLSSIIPEAHKESISLSRKPKKRRRRDLTLGALQTALGIGLLAGNTQIDSAFANASYILGGNALMTAMQNLVGPLNGHTNRM